MGIRTAICVAALLTTAAAAVFQQAGSSMVGYWKLDETAGTTAADSAGTTPLTLAGGPTPSTDLPALNFTDVRSLSFDGLDDGASAGALNGLAAGNTVHSIAAWIKVTALPANRAWILLLGNEGTGSHHWLINAAGTTQFGAWGGPGQAAPTLTVGAWTHVAMTFDGSMLKCYVGGTQMANVAAAFNLQGIPLTLAQSHISENFFNGLLDDVRIYSRILTQAEVTSLAAGDSGPAAPTGLTTTPGNNQVALSWNALPSGTVYNVKVSTVPGGPYTTIASNLSTNSYTDTTAASGTTYYYVVSAVTYGEGPNSAEVPGTPLEVTALPNTGLFTSESGTLTTFDIKFNVATPGGSVVTVVSNNTAEGHVSTNFGSTPWPNGFQVSVAAGTSPTITVTVTGQNDSIVDGNVAYTISITETGFGRPIPDVNVTNNDDDTPNITVSKTGGLVTSEAGLQDSFTVKLSTQPNGPITMSLMSTNTAEATVSPSSITFDSGNWTSAQLVTLTGVDDAALDFTQPFAIVTGALQTTNPLDAPYSNMPVPDVSGVNLDDEVIPSAQKAWGGCGLLGIEVGLSLLLGALARRRRKF